MLGIRLRDSVKLPIEGLGRNFLLSASTTIAAAQASLSANFATEGTEKNSLARLVPL